MTEKNNPFVQNTNQEKVTQKENATNQTTTTENQDTKKEVQIDFNVVVTSYEHLKDNMDAVIKDLNQKALIVASYDPYYNKDDGYRKVLKEFKEKYPETVEHIVELDYSDTNLVAAFVDESIQPFTERHAAVYISTLVQFIDKALAAGENKVNIMYVCGTGVTASGALAAATLLLYRRYKMYDELTKKAAINSWVFSTVMKVGLERMYAIGAKFILAQYHKPTKDFLTKYAEKQDKELKAAVAKVGDTEVAKEVSKEGDVANES